MQEPLEHLLQYDGLTLFGDHVTNGWQLGNIHNFNEPTKAILENLHRKTPAKEQTPTLDHETLLEGIKKWPERTTTSPSGRHLGIYKTLGKHIIQTDRKKDQTNKHPRSMDL